MARAYWLHAPYFQHIKGPHSFLSREFAGAFTVEDGIVFADGPVGWARGKSFDELRIICERNGWTITETTD